MDTYLVLGTLTQSGYDNMDEGPETLGRFVDIVESMGGRFDESDFFLLEGEFDWAAFINLPSQEAAGRLAHTYARTGRGRMRFQSIVAQGRGGYEEHVSAMGL